ncbi:hypothetical protein GCM10011583_58020 [Streptomyces camponoticapitis]|uniref:Heparin binding hemagglutinin HbhA n=1 Tax=Streptomyces camponoticapitis TaxID=1616125 RepID=A0ABQ2ESL0_9ACTN|nr:hypothetical protein [Streptomyces camponoticapitis]GGK18574.1 hypothetical protein GCM10011583_58020 [Streptomyces camponoticapitis]
MAIADDLRKTFSDPTPLYFAAGTADLAVEQAKKVPGLIEQLRAEAPGRIDAVRNADPKRVQDRVASQAKEAQTTVQSKVTEVLGSLDTDLKKLGETAQDLALRSVGVAAEYAVKARETYEKVAERGEQSVRTWRGEAADGVAEIAIAVEPESTSKQTTRPAPAKPAAAKPAPAKPAPAKPAPAKPAVKSETKAKPEARANGTKPAARKSTGAARKPSAPAKKATPPAGK